MLKKILIGTLAILTLGGTALYLNRKAVILALVTAKTKLDVAPHRKINWQLGPDRPAVPAGERPPNIIFLLTDDLGINDISTFGGGVADGRVPTPNIDALARRGAIFSQAYSGTASCAPSRGMIMTGRYPTRTGFEFTPVPDGYAPIVSMYGRGGDYDRPPVEYREVEGAPPFAKQGLPGSEVTIAEILKPAGYHTVHIGKWHMGRGAEFGANAQGFDESLLMASGLYLPVDDPNVVNAKNDLDPIDQFQWAAYQYAASFNGGEFFRPGGYLTDYWTDESIKVIHNNRHRPFFLYLGYWGVHTPLQATRADYEAVGDIEPHHLRVYAAMIRAIDRSVGRIVAALEEAGLADNTIIVFTSDNGGAGYVGLPDINAPYRGWKLTFFEGGIRVPLFASWPARIAAGTQIEGPAAHIDLMPTLAAAAGAPLPQDVEIDGVNLLPAITAGSSEPRTIFWQSAYYRVVRRGDWKLQINERSRRTWLYDLAADPTEQRNLADERPEKVAELRALLDQHQVGAREPLYPYVLEGAIAVDKSLGEPLEDGDEIVYWPN